MDITKLNVTELKALAFDEISKLNVAQNNLNIINAELQKREVPVEKVVEKKG